VAARALVEARPRRLVIGAPLPGTRFRLSLLRYGHEEQAW
jgi:hypothetical protein